MQETFFNPKTHTGFLAYRLKTVNRTGKPSKKIKLEEQLVTIQDKSAEIEQTISNEEIKEKLDFLSKADPKSEKDEIIQAMIDTFGHRKKHRDVILEEFPRFFDSPYLVRLKRLMIIDYYLFIIFHELFCNLIIGFLSVSFLFR